MNIAFYGDSLTSGENNNFISFVDKLCLSDNVSKFGISGTTIGEYSIYPVDGNSLISELMRTESIMKTMDIIFLEFGINDASAICVTKVTLSQCLIEFRKCVDYIRQHNPGCIIVFLGLSLDDVHTVADTQLKYLNSYFDGVLDIVPLGSSDLLSWVCSYSRIFECAKTLCDYTCLLFNDKDNFLSLLDTDNLHPDNKGYEIIAKNINHFINQVKEGLVV